MRPQAEPPLLRAATVRPKAEQPSNFPKAPPKASASAGTAREPQASGCAQRQGSAKRPRQPRRAAPKARAAGRNFFSENQAQAEYTRASDPETFPVWAKHHKVVARYRMLTGKQRDWPVFTQVIWGKPGLGKTRLARDMAGPAAYWLPRPAGQVAWFDGYIGQDTIVIDEFYGWLSLDLLCRVLDRYPMQVETKGGAFPLTVKKVIITSNVPPAQWYKLPPERTAALWRRLEMPLGTIQHMLVPYTGPDAALAPPVDLIVDQDFSQIMQRSLLECEEAPLTVEELGGDHLDPYEWVDVETPFYGAQR